MKLAAWWRARRSRLLQLWAVGLTSSLFVTALSALGFLEGWQARGLDLLQAIRGQQHPSDVVIVAIDDTAFDGLGGRQPLPREYLARLVRGLQRSGAAVVGFDVTFASPTTEAEDRALAQAMLDFADDGTSRVVVAGPLVPGSGPLGTPAIIKAVIQGSPMVAQDPDGIVRRVEPLVAPVKGEPPKPVLGLAVAARLGGLDPERLAAAIAANVPLPIPLSRPGRPFEPAGVLPVRVTPATEWTINYVGGKSSFFTIPSDRIAELADPAAPIAEDNPLRGRVVLIGGTWTDSRDEYPTPHGKMPGVEVHANVVHMLAGRRFIQPSNWVWGLTVDAVVVLVAGVMLQATRPLVGTLACVGGALLVGVPASYYAFDRGGYWVDFVLPVLATCVMGFGTDALARRRFRDSFSRYISKDVMEHVIADAPSLKGERREISVLFSDLRGFTTLSEKMDPEAMAAHLNEYFDAMTTAIFAHRGTINDFIGDAVMALFGAPMHDPDHALHAVQSACAMDRALAALNVKWEAAGLPRLEMGIGVHTGQVFAGNVGGTDRIKYTVIGDVVNVGSRVEGLNKDLGTTILVTEETFAAVGDRVKARDCGPQKVKGRVEKVRVYEVLALEPDGHPTGGR
ncbi:MAG: CHASE2 domain-containing protein [Candidatus Rokuibacteriota bacterium]